jgi:CBS domain-containing protein
MKLLSENKLRYLPVMENGRLAGIILGVPVIDNKASGLLKSTSFLRF